MTKLYYSDKITKFVSLCHLLICHVYDTLPNNYPVNKYIYGLDVIATFQQIFWHGICFLSVTLKKYIMTNLTLDDLQILKNTIFSTISNWQQYDIKLVAGRIELKHALILGYTTLSIICRYCEAYNFTFVMSSNNSLTIYGI